ncbi:DEAD/DEAH box helicase, partial [Streptomyces sp. NPDC058583]
GILTLDLHGISLPELDQLVSSTLEDPGTDPGRQADYAVGLALQHSHQDATVNVSTYATKLAPKMRTSAKHLHASSLLMAAGAQVKTRDANQLVTVNNMKALFHAAPIWQNDAIATLETLGLTQVPDAHVWAKAVKLVLDTTEERDSNGARAILSRAVYTLADAYGHDTPDPRNIARRIYRIQGEPLPQQITAVEELLRQRVTGQDPVPHVGGAESWSAPRVGLRIELVSAGFVVVVQLRSATDHRVMSDLAGLWNAPPSVWQKLGGRRAAGHVRSVLLRAAEVWPPLATLTGEDADGQLSLSFEQMAGLRTAINDLTGAGLEVYWPRELTPLTTKVTVKRIAPLGASASEFSMKSVLAFRWEVALEGSPLTGDELRVLVEAERPWIRLRDLWVLVDWHIREAAAQTLSTQAHQAAGVLEDTPAEVGHEPYSELDRAYRSVAEMAESDQEVSPEEVALGEHLYPYQRQGVAWLTRLTSLGFGALLADEMGLGKTAQTIATHLTRQRDPRTAGPMLVIAPASLLDSWLSEITRLAPQTPVRVFRGTRRDLRTLATNEIVLASYQTMTGDYHADLTNQFWSAVALDEAQKIKNARGFLGKRVREIRSLTRIGLTGTPLLNRLSEFWALLNWTNPGLFPSLPAFLLSYTSESGDSGVTAAGETAKLTNTVVLRRTKDDPAIGLQLPPTLTRIRPVVLSDEQVALYQARIQEAEELFAYWASRDLSKRGQVTMSLLVQLKQICDHPALYRKHQSLQGPARHQEPVVENVENTATAGRSGKLDLLGDLVTSITESGESLLVFTEYLEMGTLIQRHLQSLGTASEFLHGSVGFQRRKEMVRDFQNGTPQVMLISLKAGGTGLTLTKATHVIHYDLWWNSEVQDQATARAHRIGQSHTVQIHTFVTQGTLEESLLALQHKKKILTGSVLESLKNDLTSLNGQALRATLDGHTPTTDILNHTPLPEDQEQWALEQKTPLRGTKRPLPPHTTPERPSKTPHILGDTNHDRAQGIERLLYGKPFGSPLAPDTAARQAWPDEPGVNGLRVHTTLLRHSPTYRADFQRAHRVFLTTRGLDDPATVRGRLQHMASTAGLHPHTGLWWHDAMEAAELARLLATSARQNSQVPTAANIAAQVFATPLADTDQVAFVETVLSRATQAGDAERLLLPGPGDAPALSLQEIAGRMWPGDPHAHADRTHRLLIEH